MQPAFIKFIFSDEAAWKATVEDPRYRADMPFYQFQAIYEEKRRLRR
jgi:hypothetical protein